MKKNIIKAFTLVELIVVITILAVLATVAFISFQGYTSSSRDSVRLADLKNISKSFEINRTKGIDFPLPDKKVDISSSGTIFQYQGELSQNILNSDLNIFDGGIDPLSGDNYGYAVNSARNKFQIIGFLENQDSVANISMNKSFADNTDKYVKTSGNKLGIILDGTTNEVIVQSGSLVEIDIDTNTNNFNYILQNEIEIGDSVGLNKLYQISTNGLYSNCRELLKSKPDLKNKDGLYYIFPNGAEIMEIYCDMTTNGGGWTVVGSDGLETLTQSLYLETTTPSPTQKGLIKYFIDNQINNDFSILKVVAISDENMTAEYKIDNPWLGKLVLSDSERGYLFNDYYNGFSGGKNSPHKCNFSLVVVGEEGCGISYTLELPYNGVKNNADSFAVAPLLGAISYSWQFRTAQGLLFRLGWKPPTDESSTYYSSRQSSYIMVR